MGGCYFAENGLFNRFHQFDIDLETLDMQPNLLLSKSQSMRLPLTWIGILYGRIELRTHRANAECGAGEVDRGVLTSIT